MLSGAIAAGTEVAVTLAKWSFRFGFILALITAVVLLLNVALSAIAVVLSGGVLADLFGLVQLWLPFNINAMLSWVAVASTTYMLYRMSILAVNLISRLTA